MNRRSFILAATAFAVLPISAARADEDYVKDLVDWLDKQGYRDIAVTRTFLGRVRITAVNAKGKRELVCNPRTGEILRDVMIDPDGAMRPPIATASSGGGDDGSDDGDDHSGHGGGDDDNSGHGGGGSDDDDHSGHGSGDDD